MPDAVARLRYLAKLDQYEHVKPYIAAIPSASDGFPATNLEWDERDAQVADIRPHIDDFKLDSCGFQVVPHTSKYKGIVAMDDVEGYQRETEGFLTELLGAEKVICYEFKVCQRSTCGHLPKGKRVQASTGVAV
jgi:hypothetical protein